MKKSYIKPEMMELGKVTKLTRGRRGWFQWVVTNWSQYFQDSNISDWWNSSCRLNVS